MNSKIKARLVAISQLTIVDKILLPILDILLLPFVFISAVVLLIFRIIIGFKELTISKRALLKIGVMPIRNHYYEPLFDKRYLRKPLDENRNLPGIDWNSEEQLSTLSKFTYSHELGEIPDHYADDATFHFNNFAFEAGDVEYWYNIIRLKKPKIIMEIGSGHSTKIAQMAIKQNKKESKDYQCEHICIEPYETPWLEKLGVQAIRQKVEDVDKNIFGNLGADDILFIDSSHMIRPQGDVLYEYLEILPTLNNGVLVHAHDIFSPKDYPEEWVIDRVKFWNEQYLLEAFLTMNNGWKIIGAVNFLKNNYYDRLKSKCPWLTPDKEPGSFYMIRNGC